MINFQFLFLSIFIFLFFGCSTPAKKTEMADLTAKPKLPTSWISGDLDILEADSMKNFAKNETDWDSVKALLFVSHMKGKYQQAVEYYQKLPVEERTLISIRAMIDSLIHLNRFAEAKTVAIENKYKPDFYGPMLDARMSSPLKVSIRQKEVLPFTTGAGLDKYMPGIQGRVIGASSKIYVGPIRLDTGGEFLHLSKKRAQDLGLTELSCQLGRQAENKTQVCWSQANLEIGKIKLRNVPVSIIYSLPDAFEPILGTNVFQQFKTEINYPEKKLILYPRNAAFPKFKKVQCHELPFYMWADHFMIAKGQIGNKSNLNFFIDTGLVAVAPDGRQAAIKMATEDLKEWGFSFNENEKIIDPKGKLGLGTLLDENHLLIHSPLANLGFDFGGVRIHGLLGHAYYNNYVWRLDFEKRTYQFCR